jgi:predicted nucleic acid-binding protein
MFVLDTNVVSELRKVRSGVANPGVAARAEKVSSVELFISAITIQELGVLLMERSDPTQGAMLREWLDQSVTAAFKNRAIGASTGARYRSTPARAEPQRNPSADPWSSCWACTYVAYTQCKPLLMSALPLDVP